METRAEYSTATPPPAPQAPHRYLMDEHVHSFYPSLAERIGLHEAIVIQQIHSWIVTYLRNPTVYESKHYHDGAWWIWNSYPGWHEKLPYLSESTIRRALARLRVLGVVKVGNYNTLQIDRTLWYTIDYEAYDKLWADHPSKVDRPSVQNEQMDVLNLDRPLPSSSPPSSSPSSQESAGADLPPSSFEDWLAAGQATSNKNAVLKQMHDTLFPDRESPSYSYIGTVVKRVGGAGRLAQLLWEAAAKRPTGDVLAYIQATVKGKKNGNGRHDRTDGRVSEIVKPEDCVALTPEQEIEFMAALDEGREDEWIAANLPRV